MGFKWIERMEEAVKLGAALMFKLGGKMEMRMRRMWYVDTWICKWIYATRWWCCLQRIDQTKLKAWWAWDSSKDQIYQIDKIYRHHMREHILNVIMDIKRSPASIKVFAKRSTVAYVVIVRWEIRFYFYLFFLNHVSCIMKWVV